jgi:hypothetical protein
MRISLKRHFSVGLFGSDLNSEAPPSEYGTGGNLSLEVELQVTTGLSGFKEKWENTLEKLTQGLDHTHLERDHPLLKGRHLRESGLMDWILEELKTLSGPSFAEVLSLELKTSQNLSLHWRKPS